MKFKFFKKEMTITIILLLLPLFLFSCASSRSASVYSRDQARQSQTVETGIVAKVRSVTIEGTKTPVGAAAGGVLGGVAGSTIGGGKGKIGRASCRERV